MLVRESEKGQLVWSRTYPTELIQQDSAKEKEKKRRRPVQCVTGADIEE